MNEITLENYRCFGERQTARLAPLTLLVGENSTGKTSFLALIRALTDLTNRNRIPDFKEEPYDLGSFDEIAHVKSGRGDRAKRFKAGCGIEPKGQNGPLKRICFTFEEIEGAPVPIWRHLSSGKAWINEEFAAHSSNSVEVGTGRGSWKIQSAQNILISFSTRSHFVPPPLYTILFAGGPNQIPLDGISATPLLDSPDITNEDFQQIFQLADYRLQPIQERAFAGAPVRSNPRRTYDPSRITPDPEGDYIPMYLADVFSRNRRVWQRLKAKLEYFGSASGLFDEISIKRLGKRASEPFQVQIRKFRGRRKGSKHNLIDVGYGVSQALPVITELLRLNAPNQLLLQQPEVHLHPRAQAALGSLFCQVAGPDRQLVVETHSDYLLDRVRMEVRDGTADLKPEDVSILFFERVGLDVKIHSLRIGKQGNIEGVPKGYRQFFMDETAKSLGL